MLDATLGETEERNSRKRPLSDEEARQLVAGAERVLIARGRKIVECEPQQVELEQLKGRSGNFRAPMLGVGRTLLVGFHADTVRELLGAEGSSSA